MLGFIVFDFMVMSKKQRQRRCSPQDTLEGDITRFFSGYFWLPKQKLSKNALENFRAWLEWK